MLSYLRYRSVKTSSGHTHCFAPQTAITATQFVLVRELAKVLDSTIGPQPVNLSLAYGVASVPLISAKYNLLTADVFAHFGKQPPVGPVHGSHAEALKVFWRQKIQPGLLWSFCRDSGSTGGAIVLGPILAKVVAQQLDPGQQSPGPALKFVTGMVTGSFTGFCTQVFHNAALTAGRMAGMGQNPGNLESMRVVFKEHGRRALYLNFQYRVAIIAFWSGVLNITNPFQSSTEVDMPSQLEES